MDNGRQELKLFYMGRHEAEPTNKGRRRAGTILPVALAFALVLGSIALADQAEGDIVGPESLTKQVTAGSPFSLDVDLFVRRQGGQNSVADIVTWAGPVLSGSCGAINGAAAAVLTLPADWSGKDQGTLSKDLTPTVKSTVTVSGTAGSAGASCSLTYTGTASNGNIPAGQSRVAIVVSFVTPSNTAPTLDLPEDFTVEGNISGGANVTYVAAATDAEDPSLTPSCSPTSGSFFALGGPHTVSCSVTDSGGLSDSGSFNVTVVDTTAPTLTLPADITAEATGPSGANVTYVAATATDAVDGPLTPSCSAVSGSTFALGTTTISCSATDLSSNTATGSFDVTVQDTTAPTLTLPAGITAFASSNSQAVVTYSASASDLVDGSVPVSCLPVSGSTFSLGTTTVNCSATDNAGNTANGSFNVTVVYSFTGFFRPIDNGEVLNQVKAGSSVPIKFSLNGNQGMSIFAIGFPKSISIPCNNLAPIDAVEEIGTPGSSGLSYDLLADQYNYVWKTEKAWMGCRQLVVKLADGTEHRANFKFTK